MIMRKNLGVLRTLELLWAKASLIGRRNALSSHKIELSIWKSSGKNGK
jgi:hypothetical protein